LKSPIPDSKFETLTHVSEEIWVKGNMKDVLNYKKTQITRMFFFIQLNPTCDPFAFNAIKGKDEGESETYKKIQTQFYYGQCL
jgi:hypothetical protein